VPPAGDEWDGIVLPPGTEIGWSSIGVMRDTNVWGDDSDQFRPERWLDAESDPDKLREMETVVEMVFGGTSRYQCLGRVIALMEIKKVLFEASFPSMHTSLSFLLSLSSLFLSSHANVS
jgi:cytochrome P450